MKNAGWVKNNSFAIVGLGITGLACARELSRLGARSVVVTDTRGDLAKLSGEIAKVKETGASFVPNSEADSIAADVVVVSPGVAAAHPMVRGFAERGMEITGEIELAYRLSEGVFAAITGTNGKTTVTGLAGHIISGDFSDVRVTGNIGSPLIGAVSDSAPGTVFVTEISSYQLETCSTFAPHIAIILNLQPDHMERHGGMDEYAAAKRRIIEKQTSADYAILNADDKYTAAMAGATNAIVLTYSTLREVENGGFLRGGKLIIRLEGKEFEIATAADLPLKGEHNTGNAIAAALASILIGAKRENIAQKLLSFEGFHYRIEKVAEKNGVLFINDSKGTNTDSVLAAIKTFAGKNLILILGGDDKGLDYSRLYQEVINSVKRAVVLGPGLRRMASELRALGFSSVEEAETMEQAVKAAAASATAGDVVLLSPASSSFDLFKNYEERGERFNDAVKTL